MTTIPRDALSRVHGGDDQPADPAKACPNGFSWTRWSVKPDGWIGKWLPDIHGGSFTCNPPPPSDKK